MRTRNETYGGRRVFDVTNDDARSLRRTGAVCDLCHRQILFVRDDDDWRHLDALAGDDAHAALPQIQK